MADEVKKPELSFSGSISPGIAPEFSVDNDTKASQSIPGPDLSINSEFASAFTLYTPVSFINFTGALTSTPSLTFPEEPSDTAPATPETRVNFSAPTAIEFGVNLVKYLQLRAVYEAKSSEADSLMFGLGFDYTKDDITKYHLGVDFPLLDPSSPMEVVGNWSGPIFFLPSLEDDVFLKLTGKLGLPNRLAAGENNYYNTHEGSLFEDLSEATVTPTLDAIATLPLRSGAVYLSPGAVYNPPVTDGATGTTKSKYKASLQMTLAETAKDAASKGYSGNFHYLRFAFTHEDTSTSSSTDSGESHEWTMDEADGNPTEQQRVDADGDRFEGGFAVGFPDSPVFEGKKLQGNLSFEVSGFYAPGQKSTVFAVSPNNPDADLAEEEDDDRVIGEIEGLTTWGFSVTANINFSRRKD